MPPTSADLYLDLLKKTLTFSLWPEPLKPTTNLTVTKALTKVAHDLVLARRQQFTREERQEGKVWPGMADTMIGFKRLDNIQFCVESVINENIPGDLIETGVWRGGACILMRAVLAAYDISDRKVYVADSFEGLPKPDGKYSEDAGDIHHTIDILAVTQEQVEENFRRYGLLDEQVVFLKGWFADTLPTAPAERYAVIRLDGDMYGSTMDAITNLYPRLSEGGYCIIDDYGGLKDCAKAVEDYRAAHSITDEIHTIDWTGRYWRKGPG
jgi:hypothetical protein